MEYSEALSVVGRLEIDDSTLYLVDYEGQRLGSTKIEEGLKISFGEKRDTPTGINSAKNDNFSFRYSGNLISIDGLTGNVTVRIYNMNGQLALSASLGNTSSSTLDISSLPAGVYILQIKTSIFKLIKR